MIMRHTFVTDYTTQALGDRVKTYNNVEHDVAEGISDIAQTARKIKEASDKADMQKMANDETLMRKFAELDLLNNDSTLSVEDYNEKYKSLMNDIGSHIRSGDFGIKISQDARDKFYKYYENDVKPKYDKAKVKYEVAKNYANTIESITNDVTKDIDNSQTPILQMSDTEYLTDYDKCAENIKSSFDLHVKSIYGENSTDSVVINKSSTTDGCLYAYFLSSFADFQIQNDRRENPSVLDSEKLLDSNINKLEETRAKLGFKQFSENEKKALKAQARQYTEQRKKEYENLASEKLNIAENNILPFLFKIDKDKDTGKTEILGDIIDPEIAFKEYYAIHPNLKEAKVNTAQILNSIKQSNNMIYAKQYFEGDDSALEKIEDNAILTHQVKEIRKQAKLKRYGDNVLAMFKQIEIFNGNKLLDDTETSANAVENILALNGAGLDEKTFNAYVERLRLDGNAIKDETAHNLYKILANDIGGDFKAQKENTFKKHEIKHKDKKSGKETITYPDYLTEDYYTDLWAKAYSEVMATGGAKNQQETLKFVNEKVNAELESIKKSIEINDFFGSKCEDKYFSNDSWQTKISDKQNISHIDSRVVGSVLEKTRKGENTYKEHLDKNVLADDISQNIYGRKYDTLNNYEKNIVCDNAMYVYSCIKQDELIAKASDYTVLGSMINPNNKHICHEVINYDTTDSDNKDFAEVAELVEYQEQDGARRGLIITQYPYDIFGEINFEKKGKIRTENIAYYPALKMTEGEIRNRLNEIEKELNKEFERWGVKRTAYEKGKINAENGIIKNLYKEKSKLLNSFSEDEE